MKEIPLGLRHALESGECVLFIGAGIGHYYRNSQGEKLPDGYELSKELAKEFNVESDNFELTKISRVIELRKRGRTELLAFLNKRLGKIIPDENIKWICSMRWRAIFTTNYDHGIQTAYDLVEKPKQNYVTITSTPNLVEYDSRFDVPIYHLHGSLFASSDPSIIITNEDYAKFKKQRAMLFELLKKSFITSNILYIGYSNNDLNWNIILNEIEEEFFPSRLPEAYRIDPNIDEIDKEIFEAKNIYSLETMPFP